jgi:hypothetical protein
MSKIKIGAKRAPLTTTVVVKKAAASAKEKRRKLAEAAAALSSSSPTTTKATDAQTLDEDEPVPSVSPPEYSDYELGDVEKKVFEMISQSFQSSLEVGSKRILDALCTEGSPFLRVFEDVLTRSITKALTSPAVQESFKAGMHGVFVETETVSGSSEKAEEAHRWQLQVAYIRNWVLPNNPFPSAEGLQEVVSDFQQLLERKDERTMRERFALDDDSWSGTWSSLLMLSPTAPSVTSWRSSLGRSRSELMRNCRIRSAALFKLDGSFTPRSFTADNTSQRNKDMVKWMRRKKFFKSRNGFVLLQTAVLTGLPQTMSRLVKLRYITSETFMKIMMVNIAWTIKYTDKRGKSLSENTNLRLAEEQCYQFPSGFVIHDAAESAFSSLSTTTAPEEVTCVEIANIVSDSSESDYEDEARFAMFYSSVNSTPADEDEE